MNENKNVSKNWSMRWQCKLCKGRIYIVKTVDSDYFKCPNCKALMPSQTEERDCFCNNQRMYILQMLHLQMMKNKNGYDEDLL